MPLSLPHLCSFFLIRPWEDVPGAGQEERGKWAPLELASMSNGVLEICFECAVILGAEVHALNDSFLYSYCPAAEPNTSFLTNGCLMKRRVDRAVKS